MYVMMSLPLAHYFQCSFTFGTVSTLHDRGKSNTSVPCRQGAKGELKVEFRFQRCSCKLSFVFLPERPGELACMLNIV